MHKLRERWLWWQRKRVFREDARSYPANAYDNQQSGADHPGFPCTDGAVEADGESHDERSCQNKAGVLDRGVLSTGRAKLTNEVFDRVVVRCDKSKDREDSYKHDWGCDSTKSQQPWDVDVL
jgi:hypothetical protein